MTLARRHFMSRRFLVSILLPLVGLYVLIGLGYGIQTLQQTLQVQNAVTFDTDFIYLLYGLSALAAVLSAGILFGMFWLILRYSPRCIGTIYLVVGVLLLGYSPIVYYFIRSVPAISTFPIAYGLYTIAGYLLPNTLLYATVGGISVIGLIKLFARRSVSVLPVV
jgi:hypothetical protein